jgi:hypothetical protein
MEGWVHLPEPLGDLRSDPAEAVAALSSTSTTASWQ